MTTYSVLWDTSWTATSIASTVIANAGNATTAVIDNQNKFATQIAVRVQYSSTPSAGIIVYILGDIDGTDYQTSADNPFSVQIPGTASGIFNTVIPVLGTMQRRFQVQLVNNSGVSATCSVNYMQNVIQQL